MSWASVRASTAPARCNGADPACQCADCRCMLYMRRRPARDFGSVYETQAELKQQTRGSMNCHYNSAFFWDFAVVCPSNSYSTGGGGAFGWGSGLTQPPGQKKPPPPPRERSPSPERDEWVDMPIPTPPRRLPPEDDYYPIPPPQIYHAPACSRVVKRESERPPFVVRHYTEGNCQHCQTGPGGPKHGRVIQLAYSFDWG